MPTIYKKKFKKIKKVQKNPQKLSHWPHPQYPVSFAYPVKIHLYGCEFFCFLYLIKHHLATSAPGMVEERIERGRRKEDPLLPYIRFSPFLQ